jgi:flagellar assembly protein FliH
MAATRALFPRLAAEHGMDEIEAVVAQCLELARHEPAIVFKFHPDTLELASGPLEDMAAARAYAGKLVLLADAKMARDGCAAEWADGGADRDSNAVLKQIEALVAEAIGGTTDDETDNANSGRPRPAETDNPAADAEPHGTAQPETSEQEA